MVEKGRKQAVIKACCVIAAFLLWIYTSNDENMVQTYKISNIPVEVINQDYLTQLGLIISPDQELTTSLNISGTAAEIFAVRPSDFKLVADISTYALKKGETKIPINIVKRPNRNINIINDANMWLTVDLDNYKEKTLPVEVQVKGKVKEGFFNGKPVMNPEDIVISGPEKYVNTVTKVIAEVDIDKLDKNVNAAVPLKAVDNIGNEVQEIKISKNVADVFVPVDKTKQVGVHIRTTGELTGDFILKDIKLLKEKVTIMGDTKVLSGINNLETEPIDLSKVTSKDSKIRVKLIIPENIKLIDGNDIIEAQILLDKVVEKNMTPTIEIRSLGSGLSAELSKENLSLVISGGQTTINAIDLKDIECFVNLENLEAGKYTIPIRIGVPENVNIISQGAKFVKVIIKGKSVNDNTEKIEEKDELLEEEVN